MVRASVATSFLLFFSSSLFSQINDYIYPNTDPSYSNYGGLGLIQSPNARFFDEGTLGFSWSHNKPYLRGSLIAYPFDWFEASFQYTDINNALYSNSSRFSGSQSLKDKGFDVKFRLAQESAYIPQIALGLRDIGGTSLFGSEYLVASKRINNFDFTFGVGWGVLSNNAVKNPVGYLKETYYNRIERDLEETKGGDFNLNMLFSGDMGIFGGVEIFIPNTKGLRLKLELDATNFEEEGREPINQESRVNFGLVKPISKNLVTKLSYVRGNTLNFGFSYKLQLGKPKESRKKNDPHLPIENAEIVRKVTAKSDLFLYRAALKNLVDRNITLQYADVNNSELHVAFGQSKYKNYSLAAMRTMQTLDEISPESITRFKVTNMNGIMGMHSISTSRDSFKRNMSRKTPEILLKDSKIEGYKLDTNDFKYQPEALYPSFHYNVEPDIQSQIGGPDGFFFATLRLAFESELMLSKKLSLMTRFSHGVVGDFNDITLASDSVLPHVRTDIVKYLQEGDEFTIDSMQFNSFGNPFKDTYTKMSLGIFERMFAGVGGEILYRPFEKNYAIGFEAWSVQQRDYAQNLQFRDYKTTTGHATFYYQEPNTGILLRLKGGRYLAEDSGVTVGLSRRFKTGFTVGAFFSLTDISKKEFGEGSYDKGFYFLVPIDIISPSYQMRTFTWGLRPVTRDGAAEITHGLPLWGVTDQSNKWSITHNWGEK